MAPTIASQLTMSVIGLASKAFTRFATKRYEVRGAPILLEALERAGTSGVERFGLACGRYSLAQGQREAVDGLHPDAEEVGCADEAAVS